MSDIQHLIEAHKRAKARFDNFDNDPVYEGLDFKSRDAEYNARGTDDFTALMAVWSYPTTTAADLREKAEYLASLPDGWMDSFTMDHDRMRTLFASMCCMREAA
jgi:hypothetical protein